MNAQTKVQEGIVTELPPPSQLPATVDPRQSGAPVRAERITYPKKISKALLEIAKEIGAIEKLGENTFHNYHYQKWEDILDRVSPLLTKHGIFIQQSQVASTLFDNDALIAISYQFTIVDENGDAWPDRPVWTGIARLRDNKGVYDDKCANKCHTQAHKYFLLHTFNIKTKEAAEDDSDGEKRHRPAPPDPNARPNDPSEMPPHRGEQIPAWVARYLAAIATATSAAQLEAWDSLNDRSLAVVENKRPELYADLCKKVEQKAAELARPAPAPAQPQGRRPPPDPNAPDPDVAMVEAGRDDGTTETWGEPEPEGNGIPGFLNRNGSRGKLLAEIAKLDAEADLERFATDDDVYKLKSELSRDEAKEVDLAYFRRCKEVREAARK